MKLKLRRFCNRCFWNWAKWNGRSLRALCWYLPRYAWALGDWDDHRQRMKPTVPRLLLGERRWTSIERLNAPQLCVEVMNGMGEHYGYPRHHAYLLLWWNRRGYAFGLEFAVPKS